MIKIKLKGDFLKEFSKLTEKAKLEKMSKLVDALKEATPVDTGNARDNWKIEGNSIVNEVEYIEYLNQGSSVQAPQNFIEKTLLTQEGVSPSGTIVRSK